MSTTQMNADLFNESVSEQAAEGPRNVHRGENLLNDLDTREWLLATKSIWYQNLGDLRVPALERVADALRRQFGDEETEELLGQLYDSIAVSRAPTRDSLKSQHPATYPEGDIENLIKFFTKAGDVVLDPFLGSGSTLVATRNTGRHGVGIEVVPKWAALARERLGDQLPLFQDAVRAEVLLGDSRTLLADVPPESFDFVVTSPPYWSVLNKPADHKVKRERLDKNLATNYSEANDDLANVGSYEAFISALADVFRHCHRVLKMGRYIAVVVSDFRDKSTFVMYHADIARLLESLGFRLSGITILVQDSKTLYPYGMPYAFVSNIHHQYIVILRKPRS